MANSFSEKQLRATFILAGTNQVFPGTNSNTLTLTGLRMSARVKGAARLAASMSLKIFGMKTIDMNALTVAWANFPIVLNHLVILEAKDNDDANPERGWTRVFGGTIKEAQPAYSNAPDVSFDVLGITGYGAKITPVAPTSYPYSVDIGVAADDIIRRMGFTPVIDDAANGVLTNPYFWGTLYDQLAQACVAAKADFYFPPGDTVVVVPAGRPLTAQPAVVLNKSTGLIGYPSYSGAGLIVRSLFNAAFSCATPIQLESSVPAATGRWYPNALEHALDCLMPGDGRWDTTLQCTRILG